MQSRNCGQERDKCEAHLIPFRWAASD
jgi:hypothetical protein